MDSFARPEESVIPFGRKAGKEGSMAVKTYRLPCRALSLFLLIMLFSATARARIIYVDDDGPADFNNIQAAINDAKHGDIIEVQPGKYTGTGNRDIDYNGKAITICSIEPNNPNIVAATIIDCNGTETQPHRGFYFNSGEEANSVLTGLTIKNGYSDYGGGISCEVSRPTITNCIFVANSAFFGGYSSLKVGGGISCRLCKLKWPSLPTEATDPSPYDGKKFVSTTTDLRWTAGFFAESHDVYFGTSNPPPFVCNQTSTVFEPGTMVSDITYYWRIDELNTVGKTIGTLWNFETGELPFPPPPGLPSGEVEEQSTPELLSDNALKGPTITNCIFKDNSAEEGGGIHTQQSNPVLNNCTFSGNDAFGGGGMFAEGSNPILVDCTFSGNEASDGGGLFCEDSNTTLTECIFSDNFAYFAGGGMYHGWSGNSNLTNCTFKGNFTYYGYMPGEGGGGICNYHGISNLVECKFIQNSSQRGGGMSNLNHTSMSLTGCVFIENSADVYGGGLYNSNLNTILTDCIFNKNSAVDGGGMYNSFGSASLNRCMFNGNSAVEGGGMYNGFGSTTTLTNCLFSGNSAKDQYSGPLIIYPPILGYGGGMHDEFGNPEVINCSFTENWATGEGGAIWLKFSEPPPIPQFPILGGVTTSDTMKEIPATMDVNDSNVCLISNSIIWGNQDSDGTGELSQIRIEPNQRPVVINYNCIQGWTGTYNGTGNIDIDPCFVQPDFGEPYKYPSSDWYEGRYQLLPESLCINAGNPNCISEPNETDLDTRPRIVDGRIDMGAYEYQGPGHERLLYVDDDATGANDGSAWDDAFNFLQDALAVARYGDTIFVAQGTYKPDQTAHTPIIPGDWREFFWLTNGVAIMGGYAGAGTPDPNERDIGLYETILSGDLDGNDVQVDDPYDLPDEPSRRYNSLSVLFTYRASESTLLDGFTIYGGYWSGMFNVEGGPTICNCTFIGNGGDLTAAGMHNYESSPTVKSCKFMENNCGMHNRIGSSPFVINCTFTGNSDDGGMYNWVLTNPILSNCMFLGNASDTEGGGIHNFWSKPTLTNCLFSANFSSENGGALYNHRSSPILINCTLSGNWAGSYGGAICNEGSDANLANCILWGNIAAEGSEIALFKYFDDYKGIEYPSAMDVNYSNIDGWLDTSIYIDVDCTLSWGGGNIDTDPCFVQTGYWDVNDLWIDGDYHLLPDSPCIDSGINSVLPLHVLTDLEGNPRIWDGDNDAIPVVDMGAYEYYKVSMIQAEVDVDPNTLNLNSTGKWITAFIRLPEEYDVAEIDPNSVLLEGQIKPERFWLTEDNQIAIAKFDREQVQAILTVGDIKLTITGYFIDGIPFEGTDTIKVINKAGKK